MDTVARIYGEAILDLPQDLYIPPEALAVFLDAFEGPLDLLLYLIRRHSLDILDIPMAELTRQYLAYISALEQRQLAGEYLLMAAVLTEIKSRMLLPKPASIEEEEDPRAELVRRLVEYERIKHVALQLEQMEQLGRDFLVGRAIFEQSAPLLPQPGLDELKNAWVMLLRKNRMTRHHHIGREQLSVREHMSRIMRMLHPDEYQPFESFFAVEAGISHLVVTFLAMLELVRENLITIVQNEHFSVIYLRINHDA